MKLPRARWTWSSIPAVLLTLSACSTTPDAGTPDPRGAVHSGNGSALVDEKGVDEKGTGENGEALPVMRLAVGGALEMVDANNAELQVTRAVDIDGTVFLPELGAVLLAGLTRTEIETLLTQKYAPFFETLDIKVRIQAPARNYFICGEVAQQGQQPFTGDLTIFEAVTKAQPRKDSANLGRVSLIRADPRDPYAVTIDLQHLIETGDSTNNLHVQEHDVIYVPAVDPK